MSSPNFVRKHPASGGVYKNLKNNSYYIVLCRGLHTESGTDLVVYLKKKLGFPRSLGIWMIVTGFKLIKEFGWVRPVEMWDDKFKR